MTSADCLCEEKNQPTNHMNQSTYILYTYTKRYTLVRFKIALSSYQKSGDVKIFRVGRNGMVWYTMLYILYMMMVGGVMKLSRLVINFKVKTFNSHLGVCKNYVKGRSKWQDFSFFSFLFYFKFCFRFMICIICGFNYYIVNVLKITTL